MTAPAVRTVGNALDEATRRLGEAGIPDPRREAVALVALAVGSDRGGVVARHPDPLPPAEDARIETWLASRLRRVPLQHLSGVAEFRGLEFAVGPDVLIPRPETEDLVAAVLEAGLPEGAAVADLGTGSGCIAVSLANERPSWHLTAIDLSDKALEVARANAARHGVAARVAFTLRSFGAVPPAECYAFDGVVSNPPYIPEAEWDELAPEVRDHEPKSALVPGPTGNEAYAAVVAAASTMLRPGGVLALELGWTSEAAVRELVARAGFGEVRVRPDLQGIPRVLIARLGSIDARGR